MADIRSCERCGALFSPRREHARFCSVRCRVEWNRETMGDASAGASALVWSITAMCDTTQRLPLVNVEDGPRAFAMIGEAVWWVTIVDATLVRYHQKTYDAVMGDSSPAERRLTEETLGGLRFVRNRIAQETPPAEIVEPGRQPITGGGPITGWAWRSLPEPALALLPPRGQAWELTRYRAYQAQLAGRTVGETFGRAVEFLRLAAAQATFSPAVGAHAAR